MEEARWLLESLPAEICEGAGHLDWSDDDTLSGLDWMRDRIDRTLADKERIQVLAALTALAER